MKKNERDQLAAMSHQMKVLAADMNAALTPTSVKKPVYVPEDISPWDAQMAATSIVMDEGVEQVPPWSEMLEDEAPAPAKKPLPNLANDILFLSAALRRQFPVMSLSCDPEGPRFLSDHDIRHRPKQGDLLPARRSMLVKPSSERPNANRVELHASIGQSFDYQPLVTLHNLPGRDPEFTLDKLRAFAAAFAFFADEAEKHAASRDANRIASRTFTCTIS